MTDAQKIATLTAGKDKLEQSLPMLRAAGYDTADLQDFIRHLNADIIDLMVPA
jgi:hypothetical protein